MGKKINFSYDMNARKPVCPACGSGQVYTKTNGDRVCRLCGNVARKKETPGRE